jgi:uncharacterized membrane protein
MIGLAIGAAALCGLMFHKVRRYHAYARGYGHGFHAHHHGMSGPFSHMGPPWMTGRRASMYYAVLAELDLSPAQDKVIRTEVNALREKLREVRSEPRAMRADLARAIGGGVFDRAALDGAFGRHDALFADLRAHGIGALERIHAVLDDGQRARLVELLDRQHRGWGHGPYRG